MENLDARVQAAVRHLWLTRNAQAGEQAKRGVTDQGARSAVTGEKQMDGFVKIVGDILDACGISNEEIFTIRIWNFPATTAPRSNGMFWL